MSIYHIYLALGALDSYSRPVPPRHGQPRAEPNSSRKCVFRASITRSLQAKRAYCVFSWPVYHRAAIPVRRPGSPGCARRSLGLRRRYRDPLALLPACPRPSTAPPVATSSDAGCSSALRGLRTFCARRHAQLRPLADIPGVRVGWHCLAAPGPGGSRATCPLPSRTRGRPCADRQARCAAYNEARPCCLSRPGLGPGPPRGRVGLACGGAAGILHMLI